MATAQELNKYKPEIKSETRTRYSIAELLAMNPEKDSPLQTPLPVDEDKSDVESYDGKTVRTPLESFEVREYKGDVEGTYKGPYNVFVRGLEKRSDSGNWVPIPNRTGSYVQVLFESGKKRETELTEDQIRMAKLYALGNHMPRRYRIEVMITKGSDFCQTFELIPDPERMIYTQHFAPGSECRFFVAQEKRTDAKNHHIGHKLKIVLHKNAKA